MEDFNHFLIRNLSKIVIVETNRFEHRVVFEAHYVVGLPPQFGKPIARRHRHRKHEPLRIAHASGAQSRAGRSARRDAVVNHNRRAASDLRAFAIAQVTLALPLDFGEFGIANGFELGFVNSNVLNDILIAHDDRAPAVGNRTIANSGWKGTPTLRTRIKSSGASSAAATSAATATPPRGSARIVGSCSLYPASATASLRPASERFLNGMMFSSFELRYVFTFAHHTLVWLVDAFIPRERTALERLAQVIKMTVHRLANEALLPLQFRPIQAVVKASLRQLTDAATQRTLTAVFICFPMDHLHPSLETSKHGRQLREKGSGANSDLTHWTRKRLPLKFCCGRHGRLFQMDSICWSVKISLS